MADIRVTSLRAGVSFPSGTRVLLVTITVDGEPQERVVAISEEHARGLAADLLSSRTVETPAIELN